MLCPESSIQVSVAVLVILAKGIDPGARVPRCVLSLEPSVWNGSLVFA